MFEELKNRFSHLEFINLEEIQGEGEVHQTGLYLCTIVTERVFGFVDRTKLEMFKKRVKGGMMKTSHI